MVCLGAWARRTRWIRRPWINRFVWWLQSRGHRAIPWRDGKTPAATCSRSTESSSRDVDERSRCETSSTHRRWPSSIFRPSDGSERRDHCSGVDLWSCGVWHCWWCFGWERVMRPGFNDKGTRLAVVLFTKLVYGLRKACWLPLTVFYWMPFCQTAAPFLKGTEYLTLNQPAYAFVLLAVYHRYEI